MSSASSFSTTCPPPTNGTSRSTRRSSSSKASSSDRLPPRGALRESNFRGRSGARSHGQRYGHSQGPLACATRRGGSLYLRLLRLRHLWIKHPNAIHGGVRFHGPVH